MLINKTYNFRIYPTPFQANLLDRTFGCCRFVYNKILYLHQQFYEQHKGNTEVLKTFKWDMEADLKKEFTFLSEVDKCGLQQSKRHLVGAYKLYFKSLNGGTHYNRPKFKNKNSKQSYKTVNNAGAKTKQLRMDFDKKMVRLPKVGFIKYADDRMFDGYISSITVTKSRTGKYYAAVLVREEIEVPNKVTLGEAKVFSGDMSCESFIISEEEKFENPKFYHRIEKKLKRAHRSFDRKKEGSKNREKFRRIKLAKLYEKVTNQKRDWEHKKANYVLSHYDVVAIEDLNIEGMKRFNKGISKTVTLDFSWSNFTRILAYKAELRGKHFVKINRFFPSSKKCSACGEIRKELTLAEREFVCHSCGIMEDRDINAARNIKTEGIRVLNELNSTAGVAGIDACGKSVRPLVSTRAVLSEARIPFKGKTQEVKIPLRKWFESSIFRN